MTDRVIFVEGWLTDQYARGVRPNLRERYGTLPKIDPDFSLEIVPGFMAKPSKN